MRTYDYVDEFNLQYGALRGTAWKWLDLPALFATILHRWQNILSVEYFTVRVLCKPDDQSRL